MEGIIIAKIKLKHTSVLVRGPQTFGHVVYQKLLHARGTNNCSDDMKEAKGSYRQFTRKYLYHYLLLELYHFDFFTCTDILTCII